ncbi:MAG: sensor histidine kinase, partial [Chitinophagaceae bacterium]
IEYEGNTCLMGVGIDFTERVKAQEQIKETTRKLRQLTAHLQSIREEERKRIGREIHDELGQQLTAIKMDVSWIDKKLPADAGLVKSKLKNIIGLLDGSNQSLRRILSELRPGMLDERGLIEAIEWLGRQFTENTGVLVEFKSTETEIKLPEPLAICIFRVYQEALTNVMRYAGASKVRTSFSFKDDIIRVTIDDDGHGFDPAVIQSKQTFGILGMKERVASLNGMLKLESTPGKGTRIAIHIPYQPDHF